MPQDRPTAKRSRQLIENKESDYSTADFVRNSAIACPATRRTLVAGASRRSVHSEYTTLA